MMSNKRSINPQPARKLNKAALKRLLSYMSAYKGRLVLVFCCILLSAVASAGSAMFVEILIDDYITPLLLEDAPVLTGLMKALGIMAVVYVIGVVSG